MQTKTIIGVLVVTPGVEVVQEVDLDTLLRFWPKNIPDYGDAIVASVCQDIKGSVVATFDRAFRASLNKLGLSVITS